MISPVITFDKNNYTHEFVLLSTDSGFSKHIGLLTSTPFIVYPSAKDLVLKIVGPSWVVIPSSVVATAFIGVFVVFVLRRKVKLSELRDTEKN